MAEEPEKPREFAALYRATLAPLRRYLTRLLGNRSEAQDVAHDAYVRVFPRPDKPAPNQAEAVLYTTARRLAINRLKRRSISPIAPGSGEIDTAASSSPGVAQQVMARQELRLLEDAIAGLPAGCRAVLLLRKVELLSHKEIAERLGIAISTVEKQHVRALRLLVGAQHQGELMNSSTPRPNSAVDEQAATWAAKLDGGVLGASERAALDRWLAESPDHRATLSDYCQFSADLEEQLPKLVTAGAITLPAEKATRRRWTFPRVASVALAAAAAVAFTTWLARPAPQVQNIATAIAQRHSQTLADGSRVELNAHTSLRFENSKAERRVRLGGGEALFTVAKDHRRPFIVETPNGSVRVTGTVFNLRNEAAAAQFEVTVVEGSVEVRPSGSTDKQDMGVFSLGAGEQLTARASDVSVRALTPAAVEDVLAWREGAIVFDGVPLQVVAARFAHYHGRRIVVLPAVADESVGGRFGLDDFGAFVAALEVALPVKVSYDLSGTVTIAPRRGN